MIFFNFQALVISHQTKVPLLSAVDASCTRQQHHASLLLILCLLIMSLICGLVQIVQEQSMKTTTELGFSLVLRVCFVQSIFSDFFDYLRCTVEFPCLEIFWKIHGIMNIHWEWISDVFILTVYLRVTNTYVISQDGFIYRH